MTRKVLLSVLLVVVSIGMTKAQIGIGLDAGYTSSSDHVKNSEALNGFYIGASYDMGIQGPVSLYYGLHYDFGKSTKNATIIKTTITTHSLDIPVRVKLNYPIGMLKVSAFLGPNFNIGLAYDQVVKNKLSGTEREYAIYDNDDFSRFNLQLGGGIALQYLNFGLKTSYDFGVINIQDKVDDSKTNRFKIGLFYNF